LKLKGVWTAFKELLYPSLNEHNIQLRRFKDIHKEARAFIIGTGPSLLETDLSLLKNEITFGVNGLCLYEDISFDPTYYCVSDPIAFRKFGSYIEQLKSIKFLSVPPCPPQPVESDWIQIPLDLYHQVKDGYFAGIGRNLIKTYWGRTVIIDLCLQLAFYMGFSKVYLIGCDCGPSRGRLHAYDESASIINFDSYFHSDIFKSYKICRHVFQLAGREIVNATVGGRLEVFKRQKLEDILEEPKYYSHPVQTLDISALRRYVRTDVPEDLPVSMAVVLERINRIRDLVLRGFNYMVHKSSRRCSRE